jgi:hypothetical protein
MFSRTLFSPSFVFLFFFLQCLRRLYPPEAAIFFGPSHDEWRCPSCSGTCLCAMCTRKSAGIKTHRRKKGATSPANEAPVLAGTVAGIALTGLESPLTSMYPQAGDGGATLMSSSMPQNYSVASATQMVQAQAAMDQAQRALRQHQPTTGGEQPAWSELQQLLVRQQRLQEQIRQGSDDLRDKSHQYRVQQGGGLRVQTPPHQLLSSVGPPSTSTPASSPTADQLKSFWTLHHSAQPLSASANARERPSSTSTPGSSVTGSSLSTNESSGASITGGTGIDLLQHSISPSLGQHVWSPGVGMDTSGTPAPPIVSASPGQTNSPMPSSRGSTAQPPQQAGGEVRGGSDHVNAVASAQAAAQQQAQRSGDHQANSKEDMYERSGGRKEDGTMNHQQQQLKAQRRHQDNLNQQFYQQQQQQMHGSYTHPGTTPLPRGHPHAHPTFGPGESHSSLGFTGGRSVQSMPVTPVAPQQSQQTGETNPTYGKQLEVEIQNQRQLNNLLTSYVHHISHGQSHGHPPQPQMMQQQQQPPYQQWPMPQMPPHPHPQQFVYSGPGGKAPPPTQFHNPQQTAGGFYAQPMNQMQYEHNELQMRAQQLQQQQHQQQQNR